MNRIIRESILLFVGNTLARLFTYIYRIAVARLLSVAEYGIFNLLLSFQFLAIILGSSAIAPTIAKFTAEYTAKKKNIDKLIVSNITFLFFISFLIVAFLIPFIDKAAAASILAMPFILIFSIFTGYLQGKKRMLEMSVSILISQILRIILALLLILLVSAEVFYAIFGSTLAYMLVSLFAVFYFFNYKKIKINIIDINEFKKVSSFSSILFLVSLLNFSLAYIDIIMISQLRSSYELGLYSCASPLSRMFLSFFIALQAVMLPRFSELHAYGDIKKIKIKLIYAYKISMYALPLLFLSIIFSEHIISLLFGDRYIKASTAFEILVVGSYIFGFFAVNSSLLQAVNMQKKLVHAMLISVLLDIVLNVLLIPVYGIEGAALATMLSYAAATLLSFIFLFQIFSR